MNGKEEALSFLSDAGEALKSSEEAYEREDYRITVQQAQLAAELSAKSIIAYFEEPRWTHDPSRQFRAVTLREGLKAVLESDILEDCQKLAQYVAELAPLHGWAVYGRVERGKRLRSSEICTAEVAADVLDKARFCVRTAGAAVAKVTGPLKGRT